MNTMRYSITLALGLLVIGVAMSQERKPLDPKDPMVQALLVHSRNTSSLMTAFEQDKHMRLLADPIVSKGSMRFERPGRLRWQVEVPERSVTVVDGKDVKISRTGVEQQVSPTDKQAFLAISEMIEGIVSGELLSGGSMQTAFFKTTYGLLVELVPKDQRIAKRLEQVVLLFATSDHSLRELRMIQTNGDRTVTRFSSAEFGVKHPTGSFQLP